MPVVKDTVDRLMKGYDIRLRPDFGGNARGEFIELLHLACHADEHAQLLMQTLSIHLSL